MRRLHLPPSPHDRINPTKGLTVSDSTPENTNPTDEFLSTLEDTPQPTRKLKLPEIIPVIHRGPSGDGGTTGASTGTESPYAEDADATPLEGSDAEAYAALKAKRAKRRKKKLIHRAIIAGIAGALVIGGVVAVNVLNQQPEQVMEAVTDIATQGTFSTVIDSKGTLQPMSSTVITPEVTGQIESINVVAGQHVNEGDVLMTIKNPDLDRAVAEAERNLKQAKSDLALAQQTLKQASQIAAAPINDPTVATVDDTSSTQSAVNSAQSAVEAAQAAYDDALAKAALRTVKAPAGGSIVALNAQVGADVAESLGGTNGTSGPLMQIADLSKMKVTIQVDEQDIANVAVDQTATITCPAFTDLMLTGRVTAIASIASGNTSTMSYDMGGSPTFAVDILIDSPDARLKPGMTAEVSLTTQQLDNVVMVPVTALLTDDGQSYYVNVETDPETHAMERLDVEVIAKNDDFAVIGKPADAPADQNPDMPESPLSDGDVLVIAGGSMPEGMVDGVESGGGMAVL